MRGQRVDERAPGDAESAAHRRLAGADIEGGSDGF
jgi:hypothetical protein